MLVAVWKKIFGLPLRRQVTQMFKSSFSMATTSMPVGVTALEIGATRKDLRAVVGPR